MVKDRKVSSERKYIKEKKNTNKNIQLTNKKTNRKVMLNIDTDTETLIIWFSLSDFISFSVSLFW